MSNHRVTIRLVEKPRKGHTQVLIEDGSIRVDPEVPPLYVQQGRALLAEVSVQVPKPHQAEFGHVAVSCIQWGMAAQLEGVQDGAPNTPAFYSVEMRDVWVAAGKALEENRQRREREALQRGREHHALVCAVRAERNGNEP